MTLEQIAEKIEGINEKIDLIMTPVKTDVSDIKKKVEDHQDRLTSLEGFKEGHQRDHEAGLSRWRFNWEIIAASGIVGGVLAWLSNHQG